MNSMKIREANQSDIEELAYVHIESWRTTYSSDSVQPCEPKSSTWSQRTLRLSGS